MERLVRFLHAVWRQLGRPQRLKTEALCKTFHLSPHCSGYSSGKCFQKIRGSGVCCCPDMISRSCGGNVTGPFCRAGFPRKIRCLRTIRKKHGRKKRFPHMPGKARTGERHRYREPGICFLRLQTTSPLVCRMYRTISASVKAQADSVQAKRVC